MGWDEPDAVEHAYVAGVRAMNVKTSAISEPTVTAEGLIRADERSERKPTAGAFCKYMGGGLGEIYLFLFEDYSPASALIFNCCGHFGQASIINYEFN